MKKKKKRKRKRGKKVSLPNKVAPIIVVPHENESKIIVEDDALDDDLVMPIACCDDLISLAHNNELSLLMGYEEMKCITNYLPVFARDKLLGLDL